VKEKMFEKIFTNYPTKGDAMGICPYFFTRNPKKLCESFNKCFTKF
jgi:hypothetical protein